MSRLNDVGFIKNLSQMGTELLEEKPRIHILPTIQKRLERPPDPVELDRKLIQSKREIYSNILNILLFFGIIAVVYVLLRYRMEKKQITKVEFETLDNQSSKTSE